MSRERGFALTAVAWSLVALVLLGAVVPAGAASDATASNASAAETADGGELVGRYPLDSGTTYWQGWSVTFNASRIIDDPAAASRRERRFQIRRVESGRAADLVRAFVVDANATYDIPTARLSGRYVIQYRGRTVHVSDGVGYLSSLPNGTAVDVSNSAWRIREQTLRAEWSDTSLYPGQKPEVTVTSDRESFPAVAVRGPGVSFEQLRAAFPESALHPAFDARRARDVLLLDGGSPQSYRVEVAELPGGTRDLWFSAADTTASARTRIRITQPASSTRFLDIERTEEVGDVVEMTVRCGRCVLVVNGRHAGFIDAVELRDQDGDGQVTVRMNTRYLGLEQIRDGRSFKTSDRRTILWDGSRLAGENRNIGDAKTLGGVRTALDAEGRSTPPPPGYYEVHLATSSNIARTLGELEVRTETDARTVQLLDRSFGGVTTHAAPAAYDTEYTVAELSGRITPRSRVALGDHVVFEVAASGIYGSVPATTTNFSVLEERGVEIEVFSPASQLGHWVNRVRFGDEHVRFLADPDSNRFFVIVDTQRVRTRNPIEPGDKFRLSFSLDGNDYPYVRRGQRERVAGRIVFEEPTVRFDPGALSVLTTRPVVVSGTTNVAPGTSLRITATPNGTGEWIKRTRARVRSNGTFRTRMDFSNLLAGEGFTVEVSRARTTLRRVGGRAVTPTPTPGPEPTSPDRTATPSPTPPPTSATPAPGSPASPTPATTVTTPRAGNGTDEGLVPGLPVPSLPLPSVPLPGPSWLWLVVGVGLGVAVVFGAVAATRVR